MQERHGAQFGSKIGFILASVVRVTSSSVIRQMS